MGNGIRAEVKLEDPPRCPITSVSGDTGTSVTSVSRSTNPNHPNRVTEEFLLDGDHLSDTTNTDDVEISEVFAYGSSHSYRFTRRSGRGCPCERVEEFDCPVRDVHSRDNALYMTFHASDIEQLQSVIAQLRDGGNASLDIQRLLQTGGDPDDENLVFMDASRLTARQREVLKTAHEMGYFEHPKDANAGDVAETLDITTSTFTEHLSAAQRKIFTALMQA